MSRFDIELLYVFDEIYKTRNVTRAADNLGMPQSTVSIALGKLRKHFGDRLFSRTTKGMEPTPHAQDVILDVRATIAALEHALSHRVIFDAKKETREFKICMTDISEVVLLPRLLNYLSVEAPGICFDISKISPDTPRDLEDGEVDLAVGFMPHLEAGFYQQKLFDQNFVCLAALDHPRIHSALTREAFINERHLAVKTSGTGHFIVDKILAQEGIKRKSILQLPSFLAVARIVAQTTFIATVPEKFGLAMRDKESLQLLTPPVSLPNFSVKQHWHERYHADPANRWLRQTLAQLFAE
ncbi:LysR family transcriptional regulator [Undibacterium arcticum]|uniref:LysR family transcriptional regulator n=2 Tax=Undibacterium arcticum TaxID=1762892 RepID=A0ABV7F2K7_9BURK